MVLPKSKFRGGFNKPIQLSLWIRDTLADGRQTWANELYSEYSAAVKAQPFSSRRGRARAGTSRKVISYEGFRTYIYLLHRMGLIEYISVPPGETIAQYKRRKGAAASAANPDLLRRNFFRAVADRLGDAAWSNVWQAYKGYDKLT